VTKLIVGGLQIIMRATIKLEIANKSPDKEKKYTRVESKNVIKSFSTKLRSKLRSMPFEPSHRTTPLGTELMEITTLKQ
jgi:hypothetical protein